MTEFKIRENVQGKETYETACVQTLAVYLVLLSVFAAYFSVFEIDVEFWASAVLMVLPVLFSSLVLYRKKGRRKKAVLPFVTASVCMAAGNLWQMRGFLPLVDSFVKRYNQFYVEVLPVPEGEAWWGGVLITLAGIQLLLSAVLVLGARTKKAGMALAPVLAIPVVLAAVVGCMPSWETSWGLIAAGAFYLIASHQSGRLLRNVGSVAVVLGIVYICSVIAVPEIEDYREAHKAEYRKIKDTLIDAQQISLGELVSGDAEDGSNYSEGGIGKGNLRGLEEHRPKGTKKMEITLSEKPYSTVYRREYIGVRYTGDKWKKEKLQEDYLNFPGELKQLKELSDSLDSSSVERVEEGIDASFEDLSYSLTPGKKPEGKDFTEYFLFENKKGFCVHFATAATLLYRGCGYPARYVEGYAVPASAFSQQADGTYKADVTDEMAHAWSETLDEALDWQIREHTKSDTGAADAAVEEEIPSAIEESLADETNTTAENMQETNNVEDITEKTGEGEGKAEDSFGGKRRESGRRVLRSALLVIGILALGAALFLIQQKIRYQKKLYRFCKKKGNQGIASMYQAVYELCENFSGGKCPEEQMKQEFPQLSGEEWDWMYDCAQRAAFGEKSISKEERKRMYRLYQKLRKGMLAEMSGRRKLWFIYVKGN